MKDHSTSRLADRDKKILQHRRECVSRSIEFRASNGNDAVPADRLAGFIRLIEPVAHLLRFLSLQSVRADRCAHPCLRS
ncbi:hypothetical protein [Burkholderia cepacia]|uniref:hypothetical protein n=1 Tax=Burkholderia cepacia TaxID=292 RepID=UPI00398EF168